MAGRQRQDVVRALLGILFLTMFSLHAAQGTVQTVTVHTTAMRVAGAHSAMRSALHTVSSVRAGHEKSGIAYPVDSLGQPLIHDVEGVDILFQANLDVDWEDRANHAALDEYLDALLEVGAQDGGIGDWLGSKWDAAKDWGNEKVEDLNNYVGDKVDSVIASDELREAMDGMQNLARRLTASSPTTPSVVDVVLAILFGLINGLTFGFGDIFRDGIRKMRDDPKCAELWERVKTAFTDQIKVMVSAVHGVFDRRVRGSSSRIDWVKDHLGKAIDGFKEILASIWALCTECEGLMDILKPLILMIVVGLILTIILLAIPGIGWLIKLAAIIVTIIVGASFIFRTAKKFVLALQGCVTEDVCTKQHKIDMVEAASETVGFIFAVIFLSTGGAVDDIKDAGAQFRRIGQKFKLEYQPAMKAKFQSFSNTMKGAKAGNANVRTELAAYKGRPAVTSTTTTTTVTSSTSTSASTTAATTTRATTGGARTDGIWFNYKARRWQGPNGFVKAPSGMPRYDANVGRWRAPNGRFVKAPTQATRVITPAATTSTTTAATASVTATRTATAPSRPGMYWDGRPQVQRWREVATGKFAAGPKPPSYNGVYFDGRPQVMRWRDSASGRFVKAPEVPVTAATSTSRTAATVTATTTTRTATAPSRPGMYWDGRPQVQRWREVATGKFAAGPKPPSYNGVYWDGRPQVMRWRDSATGRFVKAPEVPVVAPAASRSTTVIRSGKREGIVWDGRPQVQRWRDLRTGRFAKGPRIVWDGRPQVMRWRDLSTGRFVRGPKPPAFPPQSIEAGVHFNTATHRWVSSTNTVIRVQPIRRGMITFDPRSGKWYSHRGRAAYPPKFPIWKDGAWRGADGHVAPSWGPWPRWDPNVSRWRDALGRFSKPPTQPQVVLPLGWNEPSRELGVHLWHAWELAFRIAQLGGEGEGGADEEVTDNVVDDEEGPEPVVEPVVDDNTDTDTNTDPVVEPVVDDNTDTDTTDPVDIDRRNNNNDGGDPIVRPPHVIRRPDEDENQIRDNKRPVDPVVIVDDGSKGDEVDTNGQVRDNVNPVVIEDNKGDEVDNTDNGGQIRDNNNGGQVRDERDEVVIEDTEKDGGQVVAVDTEDGLVIDPANQRDPEPETPVEGTAVVTPGTTDGVVVRDREQVTERDSTTGPNWVPRREEDDVRRRLEEEEETQVEHTIDPSEHVPEPEDGIYPDEVTATNDVEGSSGDISGQVRDNAVVEPRDNSGQVRDNAVVEPRDNSGQVRDNAVVEPRDNSGQVRDHSGQVRTEGPSGQVRNHHSTSGPVSTDAVVADEGSRLDRVEAEVASLKSDVGTIKREVEVLVRSSASERNAAQRELDNK